MSSTTTWGDQIVAMAVSECNRSCPWCFEKPWRDQNPGYHLPLEDLERLLTVTKESGYHFKAFAFGGGEPLLYNHIVDGIRMVKESGIADHFYLMVNSTSSDKKLVALDRVLPILGRKDVVQIALYGKNMNTSDPYGGRLDMKMLGAVKKIRKSKASLELKSRVTHWKSLEGVAQPGTLPANCICPLVPVFMNNKMFICGHAFNREQEKRTSKVTTSVPLEVGYLKHFDWEAMINSQYCAGCIGNSNLFMRDTMQMS